MKIKWNWGTGILVVILLFIGTIILRIWIAEQRGVDLVSEDYYPKGINFQQEINHKKNFDSLGISIPIKDISDSISLDFSMFLPEIWGGEIQFYRPSSYKFDKYFVIDSGFHGKYFVKKADLTKGRYVVKIKILSDNKEYLRETNINIRK